MDLLRQGTWFYEVQLLTCISFKAQSSLALLCCMFMFYIVLKQTACNNACMPKLCFTLQCHSQTGIDRNLYISQISTGHPR